MPPIKPVSGICLLPLDVFLEVLFLLEPRDIVCCRTVCRDWKSAFSNPEVLGIALKFFFPKARETRQIVNLAQQRQHLPPVFSTSDDCLRIFDGVSARYHSLRRGRPRRAEELNQFLFDEKTYYYPVSAWSEHESFAPTGRGFLYDHAFWSYEDGLIGFPAEEERSVVVLDIESGARATAPFPMSDKVIRNIRLKHKVLVIEWAEIIPSHQLNENESVHRHFATAFDVCITGDARDALSHISLKVLYRNEWKMHSLGFPLSDRDRFFSDHTNSHYAVYFWQPNRSLYTGGEIELLVVWDISQRSRDCPSADPLGQYGPGDHDTRGPHATHRFSFNDLDFLTIWQKDAPSLMSFRIDDTAENIYWYENQYVRPTQAFNLGHGSWRSRTVTVPLALGPVNIQFDDARLPPYFGSCSFEAVHQRYDNDHSVLGVLDAVDEEADVTYSVLRTNISGPFNVTLVKIRLHGSSIDLNDRASDQVSYKGKVAGDERFLIGENSRQKIVVLKF